jgi:hypothetical protein
MRWSTARYLRFDSITTSQLSLGLFMCRLCQQSVRSLSAIDRMLRYDWHSLSILPVSFRGLRRQIIRDRMDKFEDLHDQIVTRGRWCFWPICFVRHQYIERERRQIASHPLLVAGGRTTS